MSQREALRELQARLTERMHAARTEERRTGWLAVEAAGQGFLFPLDQSGEIFSEAELCPLAHTQPWFRGVANLRGGLHGVVDLATFLGLRDQVPPDAARDAARLVALNPAIGALCALRVDRLAGLRNADQLTAEPDAGSRPSFAGGVWRDAQGQRWQEIDLGELAAQEQFLSIAAGQAA
jgi:twitching motility protein PilI